MIMFRPSQSALLMLACNKGLCDCLRGFVNALLEFSSMSKCTDEAWFYCRTLNLNCTWILTVMIYRAEITYGFVDSTHQCQSSLPHTETVCQHPSGSQKTSSLWVFHTAASSRLWPHCQTQPINIQILY